MNFRYLFFFFPLFLKGLHSSLLTPQEENRWFALAKTGTIGEMKKFLHAHEETFIDFKDRQGCTAFSYACQEGNEEIALWLLEEHEANPMTLNQYGALPNYSFFHTETKEKGERIYEKALKKMIPTPDLLALIVDHWLKKALHQGVKWPVWRSITRYHLFPKVGYLNLYVNAFFDPHSQAAERALTQAIFYDRPAQAQVLIASGVDVNAKNLKGASALHLARQKGYPEVSKMLIAGGARCECIRWEQIPYTPSFLLEEKQAGDGDPQASSLSLAPENAIEGLGPFLSTAPTP